MGIFHDRLKYSIIKPLYVIGNKHGMSNFRPVSLVTSFSKIFESVTQSIFSYLTKHDILTTEQYGFRTK
jgi:uncharacterized radical SAM superfamily Fe-S cluster-containing enzyme